MNHKIKKYLPSYLVLLFFIPLTLLAYFTEVGVSITQAQQDMAAVSLGFILGISIILTFIRNPAERKGQFYLIPALIFTFGLLELNRGTWSLGPSEEFIFHTSALVYFVSLFLLGDKKSLFGNRLQVSRVTAFFIAFLVVIAAVGIFVKIPPLFSAMAF
jgi:hypothetical protein